MTAFANDFTPPRGERIDRDAADRIAQAPMRRCTAFEVDWDSVEQAPTETIVNVAAQICPFDPAAKQALLEAVTLEERARALVALLEWDAASGDNRRPLQ